MPVGKGMREHNTANNYSFDCFLICFFLNVYCV